MSADEVKTEDAKLTPKEIRAAKKAAQEERERIEREGALPPGIEPGDSLDPRENPKVGPQDLTSEERKDLSIDQPEIGESYGYIAGMRADQMDGVQASQQPNDLDVDEQVDRNVRKPPNLVNRTDRDRVGARTLSVSTQREIDRGKEAVSARREAQEAARRERREGRGDRERDDRERDRRLSDREREEQREREQRRKERERQERNPPKATPSPRAAK